MSKRLRGRKLEMSQVILTACFQTMRMKLLGILWNKDSLQTIADLAFDLGQNLKHHQPSLICIKAAGNK